MTRLYTFCRWFVAVVLVTYGFAKIMGSQFTILESWLDTPMGEVPGFWLTWYYFGYSPIYGNLIAVLQILGGLLLTFHRTTLLGAALLFGIMSNIVLVDIFYGVDLGGLGSAVVMWVCLAFILFQHRAELIELFWAAGNRVYARRAPRRRSVPAAVAGRVLLLALPAAFAYYVANYVNRLPTPLDGVWRVVEATGADGVELPTDVYFERNRAFMAVFRYGDRWSRDHHFEVDADAGRLQIWERWLSRGPILFDGTYQFAGDGRLAVSGVMGEASDSVHLVLERVR